MTLFVVLLMPSLGLYNLDGDHVRRHVARLNMHGTFKKAGDILIQRVLGRGLVLALLNKMIKLLFDCLTMCTVHV